MNVVHEEYRLEDMSKEEIKILIAELQTSCENIYRDLDADRLGTNPRSEDWRAKAVHALRYMKTDLKVAKAALLAKMTPEEYKENYAAVRKALDAKLTYQNRIINAFKHVYGWAAFGELKNYVEQNYSLIEENNPDPAYVALCEIRDFKPVQGHGCDHGQIAAHARRKAMEVLGQPEIPPLKLVEGGQS